MAGTYELLTAMGINFGLACAFLGLFSFLALQPINRPVYFSRLYASDKDERTLKKLASMPKRDELLNLDPMALLKAGDWLRKVLTMSEDELQATAGLDSVVFLRIFSFGIKLFLPMAVLGMLVMVPVNTMNGGEGGGGDSDARQIDRMGMGNVDQGSKLLWVHLLFAWGFSFWTYYRLYTEYKEIADLRFRAIATAKRAPDQFTVLVRQVPPSLSETIGVHVEHFFRVNHPSTYLLHTSVYKTNTLDRLVVDRAALQDKLAFFELRHEKNPKKRHTRRVGGWFGCCGGMLVDSIDWYREEIRKSNAVIAQEVRHVLKNEECLMPTAFVSFRSRYGAAIAAQTQQTKNPLQWITEWAPEPRDVFWPNLSIPFVELNTRTWAMRILLFFLVFFYMIPVTVIQTLAELKSLNSRWPWTRSITDIPGVNQFLQGFLPGLILKIFLALLPGWLMYMSRIQGHVSLSSMQRAAAGMYYYFMIVNVFFGSVFSGAAVSLFDEFTKLMNNPGLIPTILGREIPTRATFFITFIMLQGWAGFPAEALRIGPLVVYHLKCLLLVKTEKDRIEAMNIGPLDYHVEIPQLMLFFLLGLVYSVSSPLLLPFLVTYFMLGYVVFKNQVINVYEPDYESQGAFWPHVHARVVTALEVMQLMSIGMFSLKGAVKQAPFLIPLPILTVFFTMFCSRRFFPAFEHYSIAEAMSKDTLDSVRNKGQDVRQFVSEAYVHPTLRAAKEDEERGALLDGEEHDHPGSPRLIACTIYPTGVTTPRTGSRASENDSRSELGRSGVFRSQPQSVKGGSLKGDSKNWSSR